MNKPEKVVKGEYAKLKAEVEEQQNYIDNK